MLRAIIVIQAVTFLAAGGVFCAHGQFRLGLAQIGLAAVNTIIYI